MIYSRITDPTNSRYTNLMDFKALWDANFPADLEGKLGPLPCANIVQRLAGRYYIPPAGEFDGSSE